MSEVEISYQIFFSYINLTETLFRTASVKNKPIIYVDSTKCTLAIKKFVQPLTTFLSVHIHIGNNLA